MSPYKIQARMLKPSYYRLLVYWLESLVLWNAGVLMKDLHGAIDALHRCSTHQDFPEANGPGPWGTVRAETKPGRLLALVSGLFPQNYLRVGRHWSMIYPQRGLSLPCSFINDLRRCGSQQRNMTVAMPAVDFSSQQQALAKETVLQHSQCTPGSTPNGSALVLCRSCRAHGDV